jgi:type I protein arginine methyltransferase
MTTNRQKLTALIMESAPTKPAPAGSPANNKFTTSDESQLGQFIPLHYHVLMLQSAPRMQTFKEAIAAVVRPGARVVELGGGSAVLSFFASQTASKVWCVERNPEMVAAARKILALNGSPANIELVQADAMDFLPPQPVDVVICEMLHVGMLREKQIEVISSFKERYQNRFGAGLPRFLPEAFIQWVQPIQQDFNFFGYYAPMPIFQEATALSENTVQLAEPCLYQMMEYSSALPRDCVGRGAVEIQTAGKLNALRFILKNILAVLIEENRQEWHSQYLIVPIESPFEVLSGDQVRIEFSYQAGGSIASLSESLVVARIAP